MVANLPHPKSDFVGVRDDLEEIALRAQGLKQAFLDAIDADTWSFQALMDANKVSGDGREAAVREATLGAARVPLGVAEACAEVVELCARARDLGMKASASDAGVGAGMASAAALGAAMNVRINLQGMEDDAEASELMDRADRAVSATRKRAGEIESEVWTSLGGDVSDL
jgi:glutamate formiminotransferase/formiminotetrahydrofolate cyclodeaminase